MFFQDIEQQLKNATKKVQMLEEENTDLHKLNGQLQSQIDLLRQEVEELTANNDKYFFFFLLWSLFVSQVNATHKNNDKNFLKGEKQKPNSLIH